MLLAQCDDMVGALATDGSDQPFGKAVLPRRAWRNGLVASRDQQRGMASSCRLREHTCHAA